MRLVGDRSGEELNRSLGFFGIPFDNKSPLLVFMASFQLGARYQGLHTTNQGIYVVSPTNCLSPQTGNRI